MKCYKIIIIYKGFIIFHSIKWFKVQLKVKKVVFLDIKIIKF